MKALKLLIASAVIAAAPPVASAYQVGTPETYADLVWRVSSNVSGLSGCNELQLDATGDLLHSSKLSLYGALNCPFQTSGSYGMVGSSYFAMDGTFNMTLLVGSSTTLECIRLGGSLSGTCPYRDTSGARLGSVALTFS